MRLTVLATLTLLGTAASALAQPATTSAPMPGPIGTSPDGAQLAPGARATTSTGVVSPLDGTPSAIQSPTTGLGVAPSARLGTTAGTGTTGASASVGSSAGGPGAIGVAGSTVGAVGSGGSGAGSGTGIGLNTH